MLRRSLAFTALLLALAAVAAAPPARALTFGIHTPSDPFSGDTRHVDALQTDIRRRIDVVSWFQSWGAERWISRVQPQLFEAVSAGGRLPLITWEPWTPGAGATQPRFSLEQIAAGAFDTYIAQWARDLRALGSPVYLRPMHEMNGDWYPWGGTVNGNSPARFKAAWARMHAIFQARGATNVRWVFSPLNEDWPARDENRFERYYPGDELVDVLALDGYNWGSARPEFGGWRSFRRTFERAYRRIARLGPQPIWIAEVGSAARGGDKAAWVRDMFRTARSMRRLDAIVWMDTVDPREGDWRVRSPRNVAAAFSADGDDAPHAPALLVSGPVRVGGSLVLRWSDMGAAADVERWRVYLNGRKVRALKVWRERVMRRRMRRAGRYRLTVRGIDADGRAVVSASRDVRVR